MAVYLKVGGVWKTVIPWIKISGVWKQAIVWQKIGGVWKQLNSSVSVSLSNYSPYGGRLGAGSVTSDSTTATGSPGGGTYAWSYVSGDSFAINSPTSATTTFTTTVAAFQTKVGVYRCTYTQGGNTATADCTVTLEDNQ